MSVQFSDRRYPTEPVTTSPHFATVETMSLSPVRRPERGFTLVELMIVVAVIAALAVVVIPSFFRETRKTKSATEVAPMFAELSIREEQYKVETGNFLATAECPTTTSPTGVAASTCTGATDWIALRINPPESTLKCKYEIVTGTGTGTAGPTGFTFASPANGWYYMHATCDTNPDVSTNAEYFASSVDPAIQKQNEGD